MPDLFEPPILFIKKGKEHTMNPIQKLMAEHQVILRGIHLLETAATRLEKGEDIPADFFRASIDFIRNYADKYHHAKEEDILFVRMEEAGFSPKTGPVAMMLYEHNQGRGYIAELEAATERYAAGDKTAAESIIRYARNFGNLLRQHIHKEDVVLYPMAENVLGEHGVERMNPDFAAAEARQDGVEAKYVALLENIAPPKVATRS